MGLNQDSATSMAFLEQERRDLNGRLFEKSRDNQAMSDHHGCLCAMIIATSGYEIIALLQC